MDVTKSGEALMHACSPSGAGPTNACVNLDEKQQTRGRMGVGMKMCLPSSMYFDLKKKLYLKITHLE